MLYIIVYQYNGNMMKLSKMIAPALTGVAQFAGHHPAGLTPVRTHAWVSGSVLIRSVCRRQPVYVSRIDDSLPLFLPDRLVRRCSAR